MIELGARRGVKFIQKRVLKLAQKADTFAPQFVAPDEAIKKSCVIGRRRLLNGAPPWLAWGL
jgi:hypothetical protein